MENKIEEQSEITVVPNAAIILVVSLLEEIKTRDPELVKGLLVRLSKLGGDEFWTKNPQSLDLIKVVANSLADK